MSLHECQGFTCPFVTQTSEGFVCTQTGVCLDMPIMMLSQDPNDGMQILSKGKNKNVSDFVEVFVSDSDKNGFKMEMVSKKNAGQKDTEKIFYEISRICYETVKKLLKSVCREEVSLRIKQKALYTALKKMTWHVKKSRERGLEFSLTSTCLLGLSLYKTKAGRYECKAPSDEFVRYISDRVTKLCVYFSLDERSKQTKLQYKCLAFLYLLKNNVYYKGIIVARKEKLLRKILPDLSELDLFGFEKNKWTEALKTLSFCDKVAILQPV